MTDFALAFTSVGAGLGSQTLAMISITRRQHFCFSTSCVCVCNIYIFLLLLFFFTCPIKHKTVQCVKLNTHRWCIVNGLRPSTFNRVAESFSETGNEQSKQTRSIIAKSLLGHELGQSNNIRREALAQLLLLFPIPALPCYQFNPHKSKINQMKYEA